MPHNEASAEKRVVTLREEIREHNRRYYEEAAPTISDREYDGLYRELAELESDFPNSVCLIRRRRESVGHA